MLYPKLKILFRFLLKKECLVFISFVFALAFTQNIYHSYCNRSILKHINWHPINLKALFATYNESVDSFHYILVLSVFIATFVKLSADLDVIYPILKKDSKHYLIAKK